MLVFEERGKPDEYPEKNLSEQRRESATKSTHIWRRRQKIQVTPLPRFLLVLVDFQLSGWMESGLQIIKGFSSSVYSSDYYFQLVGRCTTRTAKKLCGRRFVVDLPIPSWSRSCTHKLIEIRLIKSIDNFSCFCLRLQSAEHLHVLLWGLCDQWFPGNRTTVGRIEDHVWCRGLCWIWQLCLSEGINYQLIWHQDLGI